MIFPKNTVAFIASDIFTNILDGDEQAQSMIRMIKEISEGKNPDHVKFKTNQSNLLRGIWLAKETSNIQMLQKIISCVEVLPSFANFKDGEAVVRETILMIKIASVDKDGGKQ